eukprot:1161175-Pelagomonas_calceolata.AAC.3
MEGLLETERAWAAYARLIYATVVHQPFLLVGRFKQFPRLSVQAQAEVTGGYDRQGCSRHTPRLTGEDAAEAFVMQRTDTSQRCRGYKCDKSYPTCAGGVAALVQRPQDHLNKS